jgi:hypothetical protein
MQNRLIRLLKIVAVCGTAMVIGAQATSAASHSASINPIVGSFSGSDDENGVVSTWNGTLQFETPIGGSECCGLTSGKVFWKVAGTDRSSGCTSTGSGEFQVVDGKMAGIPTGASVSISGSFYNIDFQTVSGGGVPGYDQFGPVIVACPNAPPLTTQVHLGSWIYGGYAGPYRVQPGGILSDHDGTTTPFGDKSWSWHFTADTCSEPNVKTGKGYNQLSSAMKGRLTRLYSILDDQEACYRFVVGFRDETTQKDLYDRWHQIADGHKGQKDLCGALKAAGFAQCPAGWNSDGTARGGPAKPGKSRHERAEAADIKVKFPSKYEPNTTKFRAAAHRAGLCGPPASDPVHVEMPYKTKGQKTATCHFD